MCLIDIWFVFILFDRSAILIVIVHILLYPFTSIIGMCRFLNFLFVKMIFLCSFMDVEDI